MLSRVLIEERRKRPEAIFLINLACYLTSYCLSRHFSSVRVPQDRLARYMTSYCMSRQTVCLMSRSLIPEVTTMSGFGLLPDNLQAATDRVEQN